MGPWEIDTFQLTIRLLLAMLLGGLIGLERQQHNRAAGFRTNILVCVGSALIMLLSIYGFAEFVDEPNVQLDPARLAAQVVTGIGFLGAGVIMFNGFSVVGLTTAASLWVVAAIGLAVGAGFYYPAVAATVIVLFSLFILNKVEHKWLIKDIDHQLKLKALDRPGIIVQVTEKLQKHKVTVRTMGIHQQKDIELNGGAEKIEIAITIRAPRKKKFFACIEEVRNIDGIIEVSLDE